MKSFPSSSCTITASLPRKENKSMSAAAILNLDGLVPLQLLALAQVFVRGSALNVYAVGNAVGFEDVHEVDGKIAWGSPFPSDAEYIAMSNDALSVRTTQELGMFKQLKMLCGHCR